MSIAVDLSELDEVVADLDPAAFVCTAGPDLATKVMHVLVDRDAAGWSARVGRGTVVNVEAGAAVTLVFPGATPDAMSLLVDADAEVVPGEQPTVALRPTAAVWHRSAHGVQR
ncbi:MAG: hypothetical protein ACR2QE_07560 [Acidimicrobiales bacterium]